MSRLAKGGPPITPAGSVDARRVVALAPPRILRVRTAHYVSLASPHRRAPTPLTIDDPDIERLARELAAVTGEPVPHAMAAALRERLHRIQTAPNDGARQGGDPRPRLGGVAAIQAYLAALPELDPRTSDEILRYDALGLPTSGASG